MNKTKLISKILLIALLINFCTACVTNNVSREYDIIKKIGPKLYEVTFDKYEDNEKSIIKRLNNVFKGTKTGCTTIWKDGILMRNLDWYLKEDGIDVCELVVHTTANEGRYATIGVCYNPNITDETYDSIPDILKITLPFMLTDGMNSEGLMFGQNVCPELDGISYTYGTNEEGEDLPYYMLGRQILDHCKDVDEAIEYLRNRNIYMNDNGDDTRMESHVLIADKKRAVVIEFVNNKMVVLERKDLPYKQSFITNHYLFNGGDNTGHGMGYERDEIVKRKYDNIYDWKSGMNLLKELRYSKAYTLPLGKDFWYSDYYTNITIDGIEYSFNYNTPNDDPNFLKFISLRKNAFKNSEDECWHTNHSAVYDSDDGTLHLVVRELYDKVYTFASRDGI